MSKLFSTYAQERCVRLAGKLMQDSEMIYPHARIGIAASGGVDSWVLLQVLTIRQRILPFPIEIIALHINPGFCNTNHAPLVEWAKKNGVATHIEITDHGSLAHSDANKSKSACFYCAMLRRKRLFALCKQYKLTHLAFGHNADDLVSTFFMNMFQGGRVAGMSHNEMFFKGKLQVIRPLLLIDKKLIIKAAKAWNLPVWSNPCPSAGHTKRSEILQEIEGLCLNDTRKRKNIFNALTRWQSAKKGNIGKIE